MPMIVWRHVLTGPPTGDEKSSHGIDEYFHSGPEFVETSKRDLNSSTGLGSGCVGLGPVFRLVTHQA